MEVTRDNFWSVKKDIEAALPTSTFVSVDLELSGLTTSSDFKHSLFDSGCERYDKIRKGTEGIIATQVGIAIYHIDGLKNTYTSSFYTFNLCPQAVGSINQLCTFEASVFNFLQENNFDFNKFAYKGIPYLTESECSKVKNNILHGTLENSLDRIEFNKVCDIVSQVKRWMTSSSDKSLTLKDNKNLQIFVFNKLVRLFPNLSVKIADSEIVIEKTQNKTDNLSNEDQTEAIISYAKGFSNIIDLLRKSRKPLVFHNALMDLTCIYKQFINPLPNRYDSFKNHINELFPRIYDTKFIFNSMSIMLKRNTATDNSSLQNVYYLLKKKSDDGAYLYDPIIKLKEGFAENEQFHNAGWDAYATGFSFIRIAHWAACTNSNTQRLFTSSEHLACLNKYCNRIYLSRGCQPHICLDDSDPARHRPQYLHVEVLKRTPLNIAQITDKIGKFGSIDVKKYGKNSALVAVSNFNIARKILDSFKQNDELKISSFSHVKHSPAVRITLWSSFVVSSGCLIAFMYCKIIN